MENEIEFENIPNGYDLTGRIIEFESEFEIYEMPPYIKTKDGWETSIFPTDKLLFKGKYMLVTGGFGRVSYTSGRMICGVFGITPKDCIEGYKNERKLSMKDMTRNQSDRYSDGNTKCFPIRQSKEVIIKIEK